MEKEQSSVNQDSPLTSKDNQAINWVFDDKSTQNFSKNWYLGMGFGFLGLMLLAILVIKSITFTLLLVVLAVSLVMYVRRPVQKIHYSLGNDGIFVDAAQWSLSRFKAFSLVQNLSGRYSIFLIPTKRFSPSLVIDFPESEAEKIVDFLGARLPMQKLELTFIDKIIQKIGL